MDVETGLIRILEVISVNDVGRAVNPLNVQGQIEGGVVQASGYAILENFIQRDGFVLTPLLSTYLIPTVQDVPEQVKAVILGICRPDWSIWRTRDGRDAFPAFSPSCNRCDAPSNRGLVF